MPKPMNYENEQPMPVKCKEENSEERKRPEKKYTTQKSKPMRRRYGGTRRKFGFEIED